MNFSFNGTAGASQGTTFKKLEGNTIPVVKFDGCEVVDVQGVKDPTQVYRLLKLKFSNDEGTFEHTCFEPKPADFERRETDYTDKKTGETKKIPQPSNVESMMLLFKHAIDALNPAMGAAIDAGTKNLVSPDWVSLRNLVSQILSAGKGCQTTIKLITNNKGEACFPGYFTALNRDGKAYLKNNFIGDKLGFTPAEAAKIKTAAEAKPTSMSNHNSPASKSDFTPTPSAPADDLNFNMDIPLL